MTVALPHASGAALVRRGSHMLLDLHLHERLGKDPNALLEEVRVPIDRRPAQQLLESYPQFIGHRCLRPLDWFLRKEPHGGPSSSTAYDFCTLTRTLPSQRRRPDWTSETGTLTCASSTPQAARLWRRAGCAPPPSPSGGASPQSGPCASRSRPGLIRPGCGGPGQEALCTLAPPVGYGRGLRPAPRGTSAASRGGMNVDSGPADRRG